MSLLDGVDMGGYDDAFTDADDYPPSYGVIGWMK